jgi:acetylxylan esterase
MDLYVPTNVDASPGVVVALHYCSGNAGSAHSWFQAEADKYGFLIIAPGAGGNCFDATPARSGERDAIAKMVAYVVTNNKADPTRVFAAGASSGACMTQALLAAYPEVFAGGSVLAGVPAGAWTGGNAYGWSTPSKSAAEWGDIVRKASPSFTGNRPKIQLWHGTGDTTLTYSQNFPAEVLQWTNVLGVSDSTTSSWKGSSDTWERKSYKNSGGTLVLETNVAQNAPHDLSGRGLWSDVVRFFGLDSDTPGGSGGTAGAGGTAGSNSGGKAGSGGTAGSGSNSAGSGGTGPSGAAGGGPIVDNGGTGGVASPAGGSNSTAGGPPVNPGTAGSGGSSGGTKPSTAGTGATPGLRRDEDGGCGISTHGTPQGSLVALLIAGMAAVMRRRRK